MDYLLRRTAVVLGFTLSAVLFQNCSDVSFQKTSASEIQVAPQSQTSILSLDDQSVEEGDKVEMVAQTDLRADTPVFVWSKDDTPHSATSTSTLEISEAKLEDAGVYSVSYFDGEKLLGKASAHLQVNEKPSVEKEEASTRKAPVVKRVMATYYAPLVRKYGVVVFGAGAGGNGVTGLGYTKDSTPGYAGFTTYTACARYYFPSTMAKARVYVYSRSVKSISGDSCGGSRCGTNPGARLLVSSDGVNWAHLGTNAQDTSSWVLTSGTGWNVRYAMLCRGGGGYNRDNVEFKGLRAEYY